MLFVVVFLRLRHGRKTRYGWVASPYPTGTLTLQDTPSFSWRDNDPAQQPGRPSNRNSWESRHAGPVCCSGWFGLALRDLLELGQLLVHQSHLLVEELVREGRWLEERNQELRAVGVRDHPRRDGPPGLGRDEVVVQ